MKNKGQQGLARSKFYLIASMTASPTPCLFSSSNLCHRQCSPSIGFVTSKYRANMAMALVKRYEKSLATFTKIGDENRLVKNNFHQL